MTKEISFLNLFSETFQEKDKNKLSKKMGVDTCFFEEQHLHRLNSDKTDYKMGKLAAWSCSKEFNLKNNFPKNIGNKDFWCGFFDGKKEEAEYNEGVYLRRGKSKGRGV